ncbi:MAG: hypothetical protein ACRYFS_05965 [Janthinobacterium lividum]
MQVSSTFASSFGQPAAAALNLLGRLAQSVQMPGGTSVQPRPLTAGMLTPEVIRVILQEMGAAAAEVDVALALALTQTGLPLTLATLAQANSAIASAPGVSPEAYALAKSLALPTTPDSLRAITAVLAAPTQGLPEGASALPERVNAWLGLALEAGTSPEALARGMREMLLQVGRSTEHRLLTRQDSPLPVADLRTSLLRLAGASSDRTMRQGANGLASLVEGQQLLNQASLAAHANQTAVPLYFALPMAFDGLSGIAETHLWLRTEDEAEEEEETTGEVLRVTVRLTPPKLGRVQADLIGLLSGSLSCRFGVEKAASLRLISKYTSSLASSFSAAGWDTCDVTCHLQTDWPPLYHGGAAFASPRTCVDRHV